MKKVRFREFKGRDLIDAARIVGIVSLDEKQNLTRNFHKPGRSAAFMIGAKSAFLEDKVTALKEEFDKNCHSGIHGRHTPGTAKRAFETCESIRFPYLYGTASEFDAHLYALNFIISDGSRWLPIGLKEKFKIYRGHDWVREEQLIAKASSFTNIHALRVGEIERIADTILNSLRDWRVIRTTKRVWSCGKHDRKMIRWVIRTYLESSDLT